MKYFKYLILFIALVLITPFSVFAEGEEAETDKAVKVYFFRGDGCPHCAEAEEWFESIKEEYGSKFTIVDYETWYNSDNASLMQDVAAARKESDKATGVPYIIIGDKSWVGFSESTMGDEIKNQINTLYDQDVESRYDVMSLLDGTTTKAKESNGSDFLALVVILIVVGAVCFGVYKARSSVN